MNKKDLEAFAKEAAKSFKTEKDLSDFSRMLKKVTVEAALNTELDDYCSGLIELDTLISDNTVTNWSVYERKENLQAIPAII